MANCCRTANEPGHQVSEGDRVLFSAWSGTEVEVDGDELLIMSEEDISPVLD